jgi:5-methylcytosine-specific restriction endonuclease McrA
LAKANPKQYKENKIRWDAAHVDVIRAKQTKWHLKYPEYAAIYRAEWYKINANKEKANVAKWQKANPGKVNATNAKRRAAKLNATPYWLTKEQLLEIQSYYDTAKELQWLSEEPLEVDHIVPLQGENVSGLHVPWNLQILPESLNCSKGNKYGP